jgi:hypothetical protein
VSVANVIYRYEYVSGAVFARTQTPIVGLFQAVNRGQHDEHVRARFLGSGGLSDVGSNPSDLIFDSDDAVIGPGETWLSFKQIATDPFIGLMLWIQIYTTSPNVVPSASLRDRLAGLRDLIIHVGDEDEELTVDDVNVSFASFAPGDFAVFSLPARPVPPVPPIGPIEE